MGSNEIDVSADYYDLDAIAALDTHITCTFNKTTPSSLFPLLGVHAPESIDDKGAKVEVPLWLIETVEHYCTIAVPKAYNPSVQNVLLANAASANLERLQQYFYDVGRFLCGLLDDSEKIALSECLLETLVQRVGGVISKALQGETKPEKVDNLEKILFEESAICRQKLSDWLMGTKNSSNKRKVPGTNQ